MIERRHYVYMLFRPDGRPCYVGKGKGWRWQGHFKHTGNRHLAAIIAKAGGELPVVKVREELTNEEAILTEIALIAAIGRESDGGPLVNLTAGGEGLLGWHHTAEGRKNISASQRGKKRSAEFSAKMRLQNLGRVPTEEQRQRISNATRGKPHAAEHNANMRAAVKGIPKSEAHKQKLREARLGKKHAPDSIQRMSEIKRGKVQTPETRAKIGAAHKGHHRPRTPEAIEKQRAKMLGRTASAETRAKMRTAALGKVWSPESREKARISALNRRRPPKPA